MTKDDVMRIVTDWNAQLDNFYNVELPSLLAANGVTVRKGQIALNDWFRARKLIDDQDFYRRGHELLVACRDAGYDVKMDMQSNRLVFD